jgi:Flp pilus assembly protein TadD
LVPLQPEAVFAKAAEYQRSGNLSAAEHACRRTLELAPRHYLLGIIALQRREFAEAETRIALALAIDPNVASARRHHGAVLMQLGRIDDALASLPKRLRSSPMTRTRFSFAPSPCTSSGDSKMRSRTTTAPSR